MGNGPASTMTRVARTAYKSLFGGDTNLPLEGSPSAMARKKKQDEAQGQAVRQLGSLMKGKSPIKK